VPTPTGKPFTEPPLKRQFPGDSKAQATPTPKPAKTAAPTATPRATATPTRTPSPTPTATAKPGKGEDLPSTGSDALEIGLAGMTLLGFGLSLRFRVALADVRRYD
jgi:LPXTG-motif cell wall-anchored protein